MAKKLKFPQGFLWGVATSSYQVEGGNTNNDWYEWEQKGKTRDKCGRACDSWNRYAEDNTLVQNLGCNAYRISLEWSRIEPSEGNFSVEAIEHYRQVLLDMKTKGLKRVVTLFHWTIPLWLSHKYGWQDKEFIEYFTRYCKKVLDELGTEIDIFLTLNEPRLTLNRGYLVGNFPPGKINPFLYFRARWHMVEAHKQCYKIAKKIRPDLLVGLSQFTNDFDWFGKSKWLNWLTEKVEDFYNWHFFEESGNLQDFIGVNFYFGMKIKLTYPFIQMETKNGRISDMGFGVNPDSIYEIIMDAWKRYRKPIYIFENGIADQEDKYRADYIRDYLTYIHKAINEGADVRGYFYWSLLDNFEWNFGYDMKFGLYKVDRQTMEREIRPSAWEYAKICQSNELEIEVDKK